MGRRTANEPALLKELLPLRARRQASQPPAVANERARTMVRRSLLLLVADHPDGTAADLPPPTTRNRTYPPSRAEKVVDKLHGVEVPDPYRWLEDGNTAEVKDLDREAERLHASRSSTSCPGREQIRERLDALLEIGTIGTPRRVKGRYFYTKREGKQNQPILYVRDGLQRQGPRAASIPTRCRRTAPSPSTGGIPSRDGKLLAYGLSKDGSEQSVAARPRRRHRQGPARRDRPHARLLASPGCPTARASTTRATRPPAACPRARRTTTATSSSTGSATTRPRTPRSSAKAGRRRTGRASSSRPTAAGWSSPSTRAGRSPRSTSRTCSKPTATFVPLVEKVDAIFDVTVRNDRFYVHTNDKAPALPALPRRSAQAGPRQTGVEIIPEGQDVLDGVAAIGDTLVGRSTCTRRRRGCGCFDRDGKPLQEIELPTLGTVAGLGGEWDGNELLLRLPVVHGAAERLPRRPEDAGSASSGSRSRPTSTSTGYEVEQVTYPSKDGTPITMFLAHKKGLKHDGKNPTLLYGYGGFNISLTPVFSAGAVPVPGARRRATRSPTCAAAASTARTGTRPACSARSRTSSTTSSPRPSG